MSVLGRDLTPQGGSSLCTPELIEQICATIQTGVHPGTAAVANGLGRRTWSEWIEKARDGKEPYLSAMERVETARAKAITVVVPKLLSAFDQDSRNWPSLARWLESFDKQDWLRESKVTTEDVTDPASRRPMVIQLVQKDRPAEIQTPAQELQQIEEGEVIVNEQRVLRPPVDGS